MIDTTCSVAATYGKKNILDTTYSAAATYSKKNILDTTYRGLDAGRAHPKKKTMGGGLDAFLKRRAARA